MCRFLSRIVLLAFMVGSFPANAYVCHVDQSSDNPQQQDTSDCHQTISDQSIDIDNIEDDDCCDNNCTACFHSNANMMNSSIQNIEYVEFKTSYYLNNPEYYFPDINTPPPNL